MNTLDATVQDGSLTGTFGRNGHTVTLTAQKNAALFPASADPPHIAGVWQISVDGYSGPATGKDNAALERETTALVQRLLSGDEHSDLAPSKSGTEVARRTQQ